ncbi:excinuclease ABC subunit C [Algibacter marinivivus]|uniref:Excinuclease ABC subunit C n=1 Tax=Algibacter marinivivus TaxID=2100723 RepID=A0A2U2X7L6_9FLAO|nr:GIY-YIG nuclease family protein [Algibacter marinivivus]PWH83761.1 excinuclease ABC subunit C [Algibacter marinivivus]
MKPCVYILYSDKLNKYYVGFTTNLEERLVFHKKAEGYKFTGKATDWEVFYVIACKSKSQGLAIESHIKRMKSKVYIENFLKYPELAKKLLDKYKGC